MVRWQKLKTLVFLLTGILFTGAAFALIYFGGKDIILSCQRSSNICVIEEKKAFSSPEIIEKFKLRKFAGAEIIESKNSGENYTREVMLIVNQQRISLSDYFFGGYKFHSKNVQLINNYVNSKQENFDLVQSGKLARIFGFIITGIGALLLLGSLGGVLKFIIRFFAMLIKR